MTESIVRADGVSKWYGQVIGLNDVTVGISHGITGLLGPNGAGKSTFIKLVTGQLKPSKGTMHVFGAPIWGRSEAFADIGYCPDQDAFYERMTGREWVSALIRLNGVEASRAASLATDSLTTVGLADAADKKIGAYSKGMRQRVKLAQAMAHDPSLLLLDEPLAGMDPLGRRRTIQMIRSWADAGKTIIVSSHVLHEIELMTSTILLMNNGRILAEGNVHQIRDLIDEHPHKVSIKTEGARALARELVSLPHVQSVHLTGDALTVETDRPDEFYTRLTELAAHGTVGAIHEVSSPDDNLQAVFRYLVKS